MCTAPTERQYHACAPVTLVSAQRLGHSISSRAGVAAAGLAGEDPWWIARAWHREGWHRMRARVVFRSLVCKQGW